MPVARLKFEKNHCSKGCRKLGDRATSPLRRVASHEKRFSSEHQSQGTRSRSGFGNSLSRPRPSASRMRFSSLSEYPFAFRPASLFRLYLLSARRYTRSTSAGLLRLSCLQQSNNALPSLLHPVVELLFRLFSGGAQPQCNFSPRIAQLPRLPDLLCPRVHSVCDLPDRDCSFQFFNPSPVLSALNEIQSRPSGTY